MKASIFKQQDTFFARMIEDYKAGKFANSEVFVPYMNWKMGYGLHISKQDAWVMMDEAQEQLMSYYDKYPDAYDGQDTSDNDGPWRSYKGFGEDRFMVSYLEGIDGELTNIIGIL